MPKKSVQFLRRKDVILYGGKEYTVTSIKWDKQNGRINVKGTDGFFQSIPETSIVNVK